MARLFPKLFGSGYTLRDDGKEPVSFRPLVFGDGFRGSDGTVVRKSPLGTGYTVRHSDGTREHLRKSVFSTGLVGDKGTRVRPSVFGSGYTVTSRKR